MFKIQQFCLKIAHARWVSQLLLQRFWQSVLFVLSYCWLVYIKRVAFAGAGWGTAAMYTLGFGLLVCLLYQGVKQRPVARYLLAYAVFFLTPVLTWTGDIGVLTGFGGNAGNGGALPWLGISFVSTGLALHVLTRQLTLRSFFLHIMQPLRWNSGPCALPEPPAVFAARQQQWGHSVGAVQTVQTVQTDQIFHATRPGRTFRSRLLRVCVALRWLVLGGFFYGVFASAIGPLLSLKQSTHALDILVFSILFEAYVYFNFSGISFMVYGLLSLFGVRTVVNFKTPFAARDVIGYWQRWHISLSQALKLLFYQPLRARLGVPVAVVGVFFCSALWHGVSFNFMLWGLFHACGWLLAWMLGRVSGFGAFGSFEIVGTFVRGLNWLLFPVIIVLGRLIFSENDSALLWFKLQQLAHWGSSEEAWLPQMVLNTKTLCILLAAAAYLAMEALLPRQFAMYRALRNKWVTPVLLGLCLVYGNTGLGGVYGAR